MNKYSKTVSKNEEDRQTIDREKVLKNEKLDENHQQNKEMK